MIAITNMFGKNQTTIPKEIRNRLNLKGNMLIEWDVNNDNEVVLRFKNKYTEEECDAFFERLGNISTEMDQGKKVIVDVEKVLKKIKYSIALSHDVNVWLEKLKKKNRGFYIEIYKKLYKIQKNPSGGKPLSNKHKNHFSERIRNYRIIYEIDEEEIKILDIGSRDEVYKIR